MKKIVKIVLLLVLLTITTLVFSQSVFAAGDVFDELLTDGKLVVHSVPPNSKEDAYTVVYENTIMDVDQDYYLDWDTSFNSDFTRVTVYYGEYNDGDPSRELEISYVYDEDIKAVVDSLINKLPNKDTFKLNEIEFINYLINESEDSSMANYSSELKKAISYKNFSIDVRMGDDGDFLTEKGGNALFTYDGTVYYIKGMTTAQAKHIIYVDTDTTDVLEAIRARLIKNFGEDFDITEAGTVEEFLEETRQYYLEEFYADYNEWIREQYKTEEEFADDIMNNNYYDEDAYYSFVMDPNVYEKYYILTINDIEYKFLAIKDSSKINDNISVITNDVGSNITISAKTALIPLDTLIQVSKITSGEEYDKIVQILEITNCDIFDLNLYSSSIGDYITELPNGKFKVKIPIKESLKDKELAIYYITEDNVVMEYEVTIEDGYAIFTTDHFSVYTLSEKVDIEPQTESVIVHTVFFGEGGTYTVEYEPEDGDESAKIGEEMDSSGFYSVPAGNEMTLTAIPADGYKFKGWYKGNVDAQSQDEWLTDELISDQAVYTFTPEGYPYLVPVFEEGEEEEAEEIEAAPEGETKGETNAVSNITTKETKKEETTKATTNPKTGDNIFIYVFILTISTLGIIVYRKNK